MNRTVLITLAISGIACCAILVAQASKNRSLQDNVAIEQESVQTLKRELQRISPLTSLGDAKRVQPSEPSGSTAEPLSSAASVERIEKTRAQIELVVGDMGNMDRSPAEFFRVLPDILRVVQDLSIAEMIEVAEGIEVPSLRTKEDGRSVARMVLLLLAAEEDPLRVMANPELMADRELRQSLIGQLAKRDPKKAREWVNGSDLLQEWEKQEFLHMLTFQVLRSDVGEGLKLMREASNSNSRKYSRFSQVPIPKELMPDLMEAFGDPENTDLRGEISGMILRTSAMEGGIAATREATAQLDMTQRELSSYFIRDFDDSIRAEPEAALAWIDETLEGELRDKTIPNAISVWARHDFNAAGEYLGKMEESKAKDKAIGRFAQTVMQLDPEAAAEWSLQIGDEQMRQNTVHSVAANWRARSDSEARAWLEANGFDADGKAK